MNVSYQAQRELERKNQVKALIITIIFNGLLFCLYGQLKFGMKIQMHPWCSNLKDQRGNLV